MPITPNPCDVSHSDLMGNPTAPSFVRRFFVYAVLAFAGLFIGSFISVYVGNAWYPDNAEGNYTSATVAAVLSSPIAMTFGLFPSLGFYGPAHGLLVLVGMLLTIAGTWLHFSSRRFAYAWVAFVGIILWSHNNHLAVAAIMSV